ncbi:MAG: hypothetical protein KBA31_20560 [Alphaproteobacteria bacterium]|nr:hypothetical protein [Alphaproteobacteria bacterium]
MLSRIFPKQIDNDYRGYQLAIWLLLLFLLVRTFAGVTQIGLNPLWTNSEVLQGVERVPLDTFNTKAAIAAIVLFGWWGATNLMLNVLGFIALVRYRAMVPLIYLLIVGSHIGQVALADMAPISGMLGAGASRPLVGIAVLLVGFGMSLTTPRRLEP